MSYDVYWVKNRADKIADFEHPTRQGTYPEEFYEKLATYLRRLDSCKGRFEIQQLNRLIDKLAADMAKLADLTDDDVLWDISKRSLVSAWKAGCVLWILNGLEWAPTIGRVVEWLVYHDLWSKMQVFADLLGHDTSTSEAARRGPKNLLDDLPDSFNETQLEALRLSIGKDKEGTKAQIRKWVYRRFVAYSAQTGLYNKTEEYLTGMPASRKNRRPCSTD